MKLARSPLRRRITLALALAATAALSLALSASANVAVTIIATDPFTNPTSQHATIVEPVLRLVLHAVGRLRPRKPAADRVLA